MVTSVQGQPIRDCAESCNSSVPRCAKINTIDVMAREKTIFERLYLVQGLGTLYLKSNVPMYSHPHRSQTSDFSISVQFHGNPEIAAIWGWTWQTDTDDPPNECVYVCVCTGVCVCELCVCVCVCVCVHGCVRACTGFNDSPLHWGVCLSVCVCVCVCVYDVQGLVRLCHRARVGFPWSSSTLRWYRCVFVFMCAHFPMIPFYTKVCVYVYVYVCCVDARSQVFRESLLQWGDTCLCLCLHVRGRAVFYYCLL